MSAPGTRPGRNRGRARRGSAWRRYGIAGRGARREHGGMVLRRIALAATVWSALALAGCVNLEPTRDTTRFFVLGPETAGDASSERRAEVYVGRPHLPAYLDDLRLLYRGPGGHLRTVPNARWGEPLPEGVARAMADFLEQEADANLTGHYPWPQADPGARILELRLRSLTGRADGSVALVADWRIRGARGKETAAGRFAASDLTWTPGKPATLAGALNEGLRRLAGRIAEETGGLSDSG